MFDNFEDYAISYRLKPYEIAERLNYYGSYGLLIHNEIDVNEFDVDSEYPQDEVAEMIQTYLESYGYVETLDDNDNLVVQLDSEEE